MINQREDIRRYSITERNNICSSIHPLLTAKKGNDDQLIIQSSSITQTRDDDQLEGKAFEGT